MALTRNAPAGLISALAGHFHPVMLIEAEWPDGTVRMHTGTGTLTWGGEDWSGTSVDIDGALVSLVQLEIPAETGGLATGDAVAHVAARLEDVMDQRGKSIRNLPFTVWFGVTTERGGTTLVTDPVSLFTGYFAGQSFRFSGQGMEFLHDMTLPLGTGPSARAKASITHGYEDQIAAYPGDTAGRQVQNAIKRARNPAVW
ncbi:hypothetical protein ACRARG_04515 [Pseudooceanicola sp. C21-150M6]|uniref:hypothetical protein n=1 Tax=Pseudooceanicola sp. C21-150M6 TaxID=3434355 RepID=UPI003D7FA6BD